MQNQVISETLLDRREEWQNATIIEMQEKLNSHPAGRYFVADYKKSLVVVYGNSQIGKTSLILKMMGVLPEYQKEVYAILRAKQEYGDSSTVTAIIYLISPSDLFGISYSGDEVNQKEISFFDDKQMIQQLSFIRDNIEKGNREESILYIFIPRKYFCQDVIEKESFSIMDLPGINSSNDLEKKHVDSIVARYMSMATVKMIVTKGDSIQDLATLEVPERFDWRAFPNKFFIVVTMAFSQGSVKNYFELEKSKRKKCFVKHVLESYDEISEIIQSDEMEWYPIDVGESYRNLQESYPEDSNEIVEAQEFFAKQIREAIVKRRGNGLKNIVADLKSYSKDYYRVNIQKLEKKIDMLESDIEAKGKRLQKVIKDEKEYSNAISGYLSEEINKFRIMENIDLNPLWRNISDNIEEFVQGIANSYPIKILDHELTIMKKYLIMVEKTIRECNVIDKYIGTDIYRKVYPDGISLKSWEQIADILRRQEIQLTKLFKPKGIKFFWSKVNRTDVTSTILDMSEEWNIILQKNINIDVAKAVYGINAEKEKYFEIKQLLEYKKSEEAKLTLDIKLLSAGLFEEEEELKTWERKEKADSELLSTYQRVASREYGKCKQSIKNEMNGRPIGERLQYLMLLGLMEQDYNAITEEK